MCRSRPTGCSDEVATFTIGLVRRPPAVVVTEESPREPPRPHHSCDRPPVRHERQGLIDEPGLENDESRPEGRLSCSVLGSPYGIRTRAATLRGWCPRPLDERAKQRLSTLPIGIGRANRTGKLHRRGGRKRRQPAWWPAVRGWGARTRTLNNRTKICCVTITP